jgi:branched-chain amino acid transport system ATP-binding protein
MDTDRLLDRHDPTVHRVQIPPLVKLKRTAVGRLSGGERRMVSIGRGLMSEASLYLVDEPTLGLAPKIGKAVLDALLAIELGQSAMVIAEQNVALLEGRVDRVIGMHVGKLKGEASASLAHQTRREV